MWPRSYYLFFTTLSTFFFISNGCQMDGIGNWQLPTMLQIYDIDRGTFFSQGTSNIVGINSVTFGEGLNGGPYIDVTFTNSVFSLTTNTAYPNYEENETNPSMSLTVVFGCTGGSPSTLVFLITVTDTNNNAPQFKPENYEFILAPPLPPGFVVTGCVNDIIVRDIDLTTQRIDFKIDENPYFEIAYDEESSTEPKEFKAVLKTTTLIRTLPEVIELTITATDVDLTGNPPLTTTAKIKIQGDTEFQLPEEPVFSEAFYLVNYTESNEIVQEQPISLENGYHEEVLFTLEGEHSGNFELNKNENQLSIAISTPLSAEILRSEQVLLVVKAEREFTSGAVATVIVHLPEVVSLEFEQVQYEGMIVDNVLQPIQLVLSQGYEDGFSVTLHNEYASFFIPSLQGNVITVTMVPLDENIIYENNIINLHVVATTEYNVSATAIVTLHIIKDDKITPVFEKTIYMGSYDTDDGLTLEQIVLAQGYDDTISFVLSGEHSSYFEISHDGPIVNVTSSSLPAEIVAEQNLILSVEASKPRTVGANSVISIALPPARELIFQESKYTGTVKDNILALEPIVLSVGYGDDITFNLTGDHANLFTTSVEENVVTINLLTQLPDSIILENNFLLLTLSADGLHTITTSTNVLLEILKQDITTPVFSQNIYRGSYSGLPNIDIDIITLVQGYDSSVLFKLDGEHAHFFKINSTENNIALEIESEIPEDLIFNEKVLFFNILADKPMTVGGNSVITIAFPQEFTDATVMKFSRDTYIGTLENDTLTMENEINLETGFAAGTNFSLKGDFDSYFTFINEENIIIITILEVLPAEVFENNKFIVLEIEAQRDKAVTVTTSIIIELIKQEIIIPIFNEPFYRGIFTEETGLKFEQNIFLSQGYDETVTFGLDTEVDSWFSFTQNGNSITLIQIGEIPEDVLEENNQLLFTITATKPNATGIAVISIDLPKEIPVVLSFTNSSYVGIIENNELQTPNITLLNEYQQALHFEIAGEFSTYFEIIQHNSYIEIALINELPLEATEEKAFIILDIEVSYPEAFSGYTTVVLEIVKEPEPEIVTPVFEEIYYTGEYSEQQGLLFQLPIQLIQGFDESVLFTLAGDDAEEFDIVYNSANNLSLSVSDGGLQQTKDRSHLVFAIVANKSDSLEGRAAVVISLTDYGIIKQLDFSHTLYYGTIENGNLTTDTIILVEGYTTDMNATLTGDYVEYFELTNQENIFSIELLAPLSPEIIDDNNFLILEIDVQVENAKTHTTLIIEIIRTEIILPVFDEIYYTGSYSETESLVFEQTITLIEGYDETVTFSLDGDGTQWFEINVTENVVHVVVSNPIPPEVLTNNQQIILVIAAEKPDSLIARATVVISLLDDTLIILGFERNSYLGYITDFVNLDSLILTEGYTEDVSYNLEGDLVDYFSLLEEGPTLNITLKNTIPDDLIPVNRIIVLELQASAPKSLSAYTTIVLEVVQEEVQQLLFNQTFYTGEYAASDSFVFDTPIIVAEGYDSNVQISLEGDGTQWFELNVTENVAYVVVSNPIPPEVLTTNQQIILVIIAQKPGSSIARATIVISLLDDAQIILGFEKNSYLGYIDDIANLDSIILTEGYTGDVFYNLEGDLADYFSLLEEGPTVNISLKNMIPDDLIPLNRIIVLELQASAPKSLSAYTTIVFEVVQAEVQQLLFNQTYYTGEYAASDSFVFDTPIILAEGYDSSVQITLEGDGTQWFELNVTENVAYVVVSNPIPPEVLTTNQQIILVIIAQKPGSSIARATIVISLLDDAQIILGFERNSYLGYIDDIANLDSIILTEGYTGDISYNLEGDLADYFSLLEEGPTVNISLKNIIPDDLIPMNRIIVLELQASAPKSLSAYTTIVLEVIQEEVQQLLFNQTYYTGEYAASDSFVFDTPIIVAEGYESNVQITLEGDGTQWFELNVTENIAYVVVSNPIPPEVLTNYQQIILVINAQKPGSSSARATIVISLLDDTQIILEFERNSYLGYIDYVANIDSIILIQGYTDDISYSLVGDLADYFNLLEEGPTVNITLKNAIPEDLIPTNRIIVLELQASAPKSLPAYTTIVFEFIVEGVEQLVFDKVYYTGVYNATGNLAFTTPIILSEGYDTLVDFNLEGDFIEWFELDNISENSVSLTVKTPIPQEILASNQQTILVITAQKPGSRTANATIVITLQGDISTQIVLSFERNNYLGSIVDNTVDIDTIVLEAFTEEVLFNLRGELAPYFNLLPVGPTVTISLDSEIPNELVPANGIIMLELEATAPGATSALATVVLEVVQNDTVFEQLVFSETFYTGQYTELGGLNFTNIIKLDQGYDENVLFTLEGENAQWFTLLVSGNSVSLTLKEPIPETVLGNKQQLIFVIRAEKPTSEVGRATVIISLTDDLQTDLGATFDKVLFEGLVQAGIVQHESITVFGYNETIIKISGEYAALFTASASDGVVIVQGSGSVTLATDVTYVALELGAGSASAVLILNVIHSEDPVLPLVIFGSSSYAIRVEVGQTGLVGQAFATADNGEPVTYSLLVDDAHLLQRVSINHEGELYLSAPADSGVYSFQVSATTVFTHTSGTAPVHLTVDAITVCGIDNLVVPPLITLNRDEEEPHENLVVIDKEKFAGCRYSLTNRWPINQTWLYVDENGLHATAIDREHESIAFMASSQVQVELILECDTDNEARRTKRSLTRDTQDPLGSYDYGNNKWILTDSILYNSRRSLVNLLVNDINDNPPIFVGKENEPIAVGYPVTELEKRVLPRSLAELKATDADIGENAALIYWSSEDALAVSPSTGFVHISQGYQIDDGALLTVKVTDRRGDGLTGSIQLLVKLLDQSNIAVVTVRDAFLDDEKVILENLSDAVGYEVRVLQSAVISNSTEMEPSEVNSRRKRDISNGIGATLQLYVYGMNQREPVSVHQLTNDINNNALTTVNIASTISLEDHLDSQEIDVIPVLGRDTGLLVATIVLSVLLFILILVAAVWFFLKWRKKQNYDEFRDEASVDSQNESQEQVLKPESLAKPKVNIEELKRSERRLQEMLDAPIEEVTVEPFKSKKEKKPESRVNIPIPDPPALISIDKLKDVEESDDDEFGERSKVKRKSVVTFNENVEKIIHLEDTPEEESSDFEVYKF